MLLLGSDTLLATGGALWATGDVERQTRRAGRAPFFTGTGATLLALGVAATIGSLVLLAAQRCYADCSDPAGIGDAIGGYALADLGAILISVGAPVLAIGASEHRPRATLAIRN